VFDSEECERKKERESNRERERERERGKEVRESAQKAYASHVSYIFPT